MAEMHVSLVSPERILFEGEATMVIARPEGGDAAFLPGHAPFLGLLGIGPVIIRPVDGPDVRAAVHGGFIEVRNNRVTILSDVAELAGDIDVARAQAARDRAERATAQDAEAASALRRAQVRLEVATAGSTTAAGARH
jgi:F-type H+-transporting ATPase subunit epsilon